MHFSSVLVVVATFIITAEAGPLPASGSESALIKSGTTETVSTKEQQAHAFSTVITKVTSSSLHRVSSATSSEDWLDSIWNEAFGQQIGSVHTSQVKASATSLSSKEDPTFNAETLKGSETSHDTAPSTNGKSSTSTSKPVITTVPKTTQTAGLIGYPCTSIHTQNSAVTAFESHASDSCVDCKCLCRQLQDYGGHDWYSDGKLKISVPEVSFTDKQSLTAMVAGLASSLNSSSMNWKNYQTTVGLYCDGDVCNSADYWAGPNCVEYDGMDAYGRNLPPVKPYPPDVVTVPGFLQSIMTIDTLKAPDWPVQFLSISLSTEEAEAGEFTCADGALITDGLGVLAFVPGLEFLAWMAWPALAVSATCAGTEKAEG